MKYIKKFESRKYPAIQFKDENLTIWKITEGVHKGNIKFKFYKEIDKEYTDIYSIMSGSAKILDTEYEHNEKIREITTDLKNRKVSTNTIDTILYTFIQSVGYEKEDVDKIYRSNRYDNVLKKMFENKIQKVSDNYKNLGDIFDGLRKVKDEFIKYETPNFEEYKLNKEANKYNL